MPSLYTIGYLPQVDITSFLSRLQRYGVNCVVDVRQEDGMGEFYSETLSALLKQYGIIYLPFKTEFGSFDCNVRRKNGTLVYKKVITSENFLQGIERLKNGIAKGYVIALLGSDVIPNNTHRFNIISKYLVSIDIDVSHILSNGEAISHQALIQVIEQRKIESKERHLEANELGRIGEDIAIEYLMANDYDILAHNWNLYHGCELDIVARKDDVLHFVEVKTRRTASRSTPEQSINYKKMHNTFQAANAFMHRNGLNYMTYKFDSIAIVYRSDKDYDLKFYENVFYYQKHFY